MSCLLLLSFFLSFSFIHSFIHSCVHYHSLFSSSWVVDDQTNLGDAVVGPAEVVKVLDQADLVLTLAAQRVDQKVRVVELGFDIGHRDGAVQHRLARVREVLGTLNH